VKSNDFFASWRLLLQAGAVDLRQSPWVLGGVAFRTSLQTAVPNQVLIGNIMAQMMKAAVFVEPGRIELVDKPIPDIGPNDALIKITTTTICGTDVHILKGEYPVAKGLTVGHEPVGVIVKLGSAVQGYQEGQRVIAGAICPNFNSYAAQDGASSQDGSYLAASGRCGCHGYKLTAGWRFGNLIDGAQAEYILVPDAQGNLAPVPDGLTDEQVLMCPDIMSTGFAGAENANIKIGDVVVVFAQGPIGLCATAGAKLRGASTIIAVDGNEERLAVSKALGADITLNFKTQDVVAEVLKITGGKGADSAIEALGTQGTFESALRCIRAGGTLSSLGVYSTDLKIPLDAFGAGLGDHRINTALCPGGKERMRRLMSVIASGRIDLKPLVTHQYRLENIVEAYDLFSHQRDGVLKIAIKP
jgi:threonine dehydrogenase-like Zn-dependent dehydrogenase